MSQFSKVIRASAALTATYTSPVISNDAPLKFGQIIVNVSAYTSGSITPRIEAYDPASNSYYTLLTGSAKTTTGQVVLKIGPGITAAANVAVSDFLPEQWRVVLTAGAATNLTCSVGVNMAP